MVAFIRNRLFHPCFLRKLNFQTAPHTPLSHEVEDSIAQRVEVLPLRGVRGVGEGNL